MAVEEELVRLFKVAEKAAIAAAAAAAAADRRGADESRCLDALSLLKSFPVTYDLLLSTRVGRLIRPLKKHRSKKIRNLVEEVISVWKNKIVNETTLNKKSENSNESFLMDDKHKDEDKPFNSDIHKVDSFLMTKALVFDPETKDIKMGYRTKSVDKKYNVINSETNMVPKTMSEKAEVNLPECNDNLRDKVREQLHEGLSKVFTEANEDVSNQVNSRDPIEVSVTLESTLFRNWGRVNGPQKMKYRSLLFNIRDPDNPDFQRKVSVGEVKPERVVNLGAEEMASEKRQLENKLIEAKALMKSMIGREDKATTCIFKCGRCGKSESTYYQLQTRRADEPMTTYVTCVHCNNHWKFS